MPSLDQPIAPSIVFVNWKVNQCDMALARLAIETPQRT